MKKFLTISLFSALFLIPSAAFAVGEVCPKVGVAATSNCCKAPAIIEQVGGCPAGTKWIGDAATGQCQSIITCPGTANSLSCSTGGCYTPAPGPVCSSASVNTDASMPCCATGQIALRDDATPSKWKCIDETWTRSGNDVYRNVAGGKVGIGTATPAVALDVVLSAGGAAKIGSSANTATGKYAVAIGDAVVTSGDNATAIGLNLTAESYDSVVIGRFNVTNAAYSKTIWVGADPLFVIANGTDAANPANALTVLKNGTVGIGTATPNLAYKLDVSGQVNSTGGYCISGNCVTSWPSGGTVASEVQWVGITAGIHDGKFTGGYSGANSADAYCASQTGDPDARVCSVEDMLFLNRKGSLPTTDTKAWINGGPPGFNSAANDCGGWKLNSGTADNTWGRYWWFSLKQGWADGCNLTHSFACCK